MKTGTPKTLQEAIRYFSNADNCRNFAAALRWPDGVTCPTCGSAKVGYLAQQGRWQCSAKHPKHQFSVKVGTIFEDSPIGLDKWFTAMWMLNNCKNGVSSCEIARDLGVTQKTAWFMLHRIRLRHTKRSLPSRWPERLKLTKLLSGASPATCTKTGRKRSAGTGGAGSGKAIVMGLLDRHTRKVKIAHIQNGKPTRCNPMSASTLKAAPTFTAMRGSAITDWIANTSTT